MPYTPINAGYAEKTRYSGLFNFEISDISTYGQKFIHETAREGDLLTAEILYSNGTDLNAQNKRGWTALHEAVAHNHMDMVVFLVSNESSANIHTFDQRYTPLHLGVIHNNKDIVNYLLTACPDSIQYQNKSGKTALHLAAEHGFVELIGLLLRHRSDIFATTNDGKTAYDIATENNQTDIAQILQKIMSHYKYHIA